MAKRIKSIASRLRSSSQGDMDSELLDTVEQEEIIDNLRQDNLRSSTFHRVSAPIVIQHLLIDPTSFILNVYPIQRALFVCGIALVILKFLCGLLAILYPWTLPMHETIQDTCPSILVVLLEFYFAIHCLFFSIYIIKPTLQQRKGLVRATLLGRV
jgi:uncharacterized membrane protein